MHAAPPHVPLHKGLSLEVWFQFVCTRTKPDVQPWKKRGKHGAEERVSYKPEAIV